MKVWNKEVDSCCLCPYLGNYSMDEEPYCKFSKKDIEDINVIPKHCPFAQPITKEVIGGFGFAPNHVTENNVMYNIFKNEYSTFLYCGENNYFEISFSHDVKMINNSRVEWVFKGTINNPIELEFILHSIGVIE